MKEQETVNLENVSENTSQVRTKKKYALDLATWSSSMSLTSPVLTEELGIFLVTVLDTSYIIKP